MPKCHTPKGSYQIHTTLWAAICPYLHPLFIDLLTISMKGSTQFTLGLHPLHYILGTHLLDSTCPTMRILDPSFISTETQCPFMLLSLTLTHMPKVKGIHMKPQKLLGTSSHQTVRPLMDCTGLFLMDLVGHHPMALPDMACLLQYLRVHLTPSPTLHLLLCLGNPP